MKRAIAFSLVLSLGLFPMASSCFSQEAKETSPGVLIIADYEGADMFNNLGGESGSWNMDPSDENNSYTDADLVSMPGKNGEPDQVLRLNYSVETDRPSQNGFWTKLNNLDAESYDHLEFEIKGDENKGFTEKLRVEVKKFKPLEKGDDPEKNKDPKRAEKIKGSAEIFVTEKWETISIPLNRMTGILNFADPESWKNPSIGRKDLDELVFVFNDRHVTKKKGTIYIDNIRFVKTGNPGPSAVDFPKHDKQKTPTRIEGLEFQKFLITRLGGFPKQNVVKKKFPEDDRAFLMEIAKDTWRFFDEIVDKEHGLPLDTIQMGKTKPVEDGVFVGDYTNVTNIGVYFMCLVSAYDLGFITREEAVKRIRLTMDTMEKVEYHSSGFPYNYYDTTTAERTSYFVSFVDSGWLVAGLYVVKNAFPEETTVQAERLIKRGKFSFFYDPVERQMFHGFYDNLNVTSDYHYGAFYTEPRASSYIAIAQEEVPEEHWFMGLVRTFPKEYAWQSQEPKERGKRTTLGHTYDGGYYEWKDLKFVPSWGGSGFEALMPTIILREKELAPEGLGLNNKLHVQGQIRYAFEELKYPVWGMSPSSVPEGGYSEYGAKPFGAKGYKPGVVTPHVTGLALEFAPKEAIQNFRKMIELYDIYGEYGFYDAVTVETGLVAKKYLALDQGMLFVAINNYLNDGVIRKRFHADPVMQKAEKLLSSEKFFEHDAAR